MDETSTFQAAVRNWLLDEMAVQNVSRKRISSILGLNASAVTRLLSGDRQISAEEMFKLAAWFAYPSSFSEMIKSAAPSADGDIEPLPVTAIKLPPARGSNRDEKGVYHNPLRVNSSSALSSQMPLTTSSVGDDSCDLYINFGVETTFARPPRLSRLEPVIAIRMRGTALEPRYKRNEVMFITEARTLDVGMYILCELVRDGTPTHAVPMKTGQIAELTDAYISLRKGNGDVAVMDLNEILSIHVVMDWNRIFGIPNDD